jgi:hypothetical protein
MVDSEQCINLARSSLGIQCQVLLIRIQNFMNILDLINNMNNLRALNIECRDDEWHAVPLERDALIKWLERTLPPTYMIRRDVNCKEIIRLWIG